MLSKSILLFSGNTLETFSGTLVHDDRFDGNLTIDVVRKGVVIYTVSYDDGSIPINLAIGDLIILSGEPTLGYYRTTGCELSYTISTISEVISLTDGFTIVLTY